MSSSGNASFAAVVLAAGSSSRLGQPKALLRWQGETLLTRAVQLAQIGKPSACLLAIGHNADSLWRTWQQDVSSKLQSQHIQRLDVVDWQLGMGASLQAAVRAVNARAEVNGLLVLLIDQYRIEPAFIGALVQRWRAQADFAACAGYPDVQHESPTTQNVLGAPAVLPRSWFSEILRLPAADVGARELLRSRNDVNVLAIPAPGDVDLRGDLGGFSAN